MVIFFALIVTHRPANTQIIFTFTTLQTIETKQIQGVKRKTKGELINTNESFCVCVDAHPRFFFTRLRILHNYARFLCIFWFAYLQAALYNYIIYMSYIYIYIYMYIDNYLCRKGKIKTLKTLQNCFERA